MIAFTGNSRLMWTLLLLCDAYIKDLVTSLVIFIKLRQIGGEIECSISGRGVVQIWYAAG